MISQKLKLKLKLMLNLKHALGLLCLLLPLSSHASSPDGIWIQSSERLLTTSARSEIKLSADIEALKDILWQATEASPDQTIELFLPLPNGEFVRLAVREYSMMEEGLAKLLPEVKTFKARGLDQTQIYGHLDITPRGFHAMLDIDGETILIDPSNKLSNREYTSKKRPQASTARACKLIHREPLNSELLSSKNTLSERRNGSTIKEYRIAVAATGEYTAAVSTSTPNQAEGQAAIVVAINRVNQIYNRDFAINLKLVANNLNIVYTDPGTDPYLNNDASRDIDLNTENLDAVIESSNYDIGHLFASGADASGLAQLGSVCNADLKGQGVTGIWASALETDTFYVDFVAHEIGHQFGAFHTFNGTSGSCGSSNRSPDSAYEPGSGSTIMAYAGICDDENLQLSSNDYFHAHSIDQILDFIGSSSGNCASTSTSTGNAPPTANAGIDYSIPAQTPFTLTASAIDTDDSVFTYTWEQLDPGDQVDDATTQFNGISKPELNIETDNGSRPIFRSFPPSNSAKRYLPKLSDIISDTTTIGETLPSTTRDLKFRVSTRSGTYGLDTDDMLVSVVATIDPFLVEQPVAGTSHIEGESSTALWKVGGTNQSPINCNNVGIYLATDGGSNAGTYVTLTASTTNDGEESITLPSGLSSQARILISCAENIFYNVNDGNFSIVSSSNTVTSIKQVDANKEESASGTNAFTFTISRQGDVSGASSVDTLISGYGNNPASQADFSSPLTIQSIAFAAGESEKTLNVLVLADSLTEDNEEFVVTLSNPSNSLLGITQAKGLIGNGIPIVDGDTVPDVVPDIDADADTDSDTTPDLDFESDPSSTPESEPLTKKKSGLFGSLNPGLLLSLFLIKFPFRSTYKFISLLLLSFAATFSTSCSSTDDQYLIKEDLTKKTSILNASAITGTRTLPESRSLPKVTNAIAPPEPVLALRWVKNADPIKDANKALSKADKRFWAHGGRGGFKLPGITGDDRTVAISFGTKTQAGISDMLHGEEHLALRKAFMIYAAEYNQHLLKSLKK